MKVVKFDVNDRRKKVGKGIAVLTDDDEIISLGHFVNKKDFKIVETMLLVLLTRLGHIGGQKQEREPDEHFYLDDLWREMGGKPEKFYEYT